MRPLLHLIMNSVLSSLRAAASVLHHTGQALGLLQVGVWKQASCQAGYDVLNQATPYTMPRKLILPPMMECVVSSKMGLIWYNLNIMQVGQPGQLAVCGHCLEVLPLHPQLLAVLQALRCLSTAVLQLSVIAFQLSSLQSRHPAIGNYPTSTKEALHARLIPGHLMLHSHVERYYFGAYSIKARTSSVLCSPVLPAEGLRLALPADEEHVDLAVQDYPQVEGQEAYSLGIEAQEQAHQHQHTYGLLLVVLHHCTP